MATLELIFQLEQNLESGFKTLLSDKTGATAYHERETEIATSPRIEIAAKVGKVIDHRHILPDGQRWINDAWEGEITTEIITNRTTEAKSKAHQILIGLVRQKLQLYNIVEVWEGYQKIVVIDDIREDGTTETFTDKDDLDHTVIKWLLIFNINPNAWPEGM